MVSVMVDSEPILGSLHNAILLQVTMGAHTTEYIQLPGYLLHVFRRMEETGEL